MPFTVSHAVVALGARRLPVPVAAVAVGAMAPDAVLFAPFLPDYDDAHSWWGVPTIDLAVSVVVLLVWWWLVRPAWAPVVPGLRARLPRSWSTPRAVRASDVLPVLVGCVLGSTTHVVWDGFTHGSGFAVRSFAPLRETLVAGYPLPFLLQDASSVLGLAALLVVGAVWWRRTPPHEVEPVERVERRVVIAAVVLVLAVTVAQAGVVLLRGGGVAQVVVALAFRLPAAVAVVLVLGSVVLLVVRRGTVGGVQDRRDDAGDDDVSAGER
jgi:hypothetical protein